MNIQHDEASGYTFYKEAFLLEMYELLKLDFL